MATIVLFDIDGTLLRAGGAGRRAVGRALDEFTDHPPGTMSLDGIEFAGRTDPWIVEQALIHCRVEFTDGVVDEILERYLVHLADELDRTKEFRVLPGVHALLVRLSQERHVVVGLGTGNIERGAFAKLRRAGLDAFFSFGGFGCDHPTRAELLRAGLERGRARTPNHTRNAIVVGDTPHDVAAAHAIGAKCLAVCTGWHDAAVLRAAGADWIVPDLRDSIAYEVLAASELM